MSFLSARVEQSKQKVPDTDCLDQKLVNALLTTCQEARNRLIDEKRYIDYYKMQEASAEMDKKQLLRPIYVEANYRRRMLFYVDSIDRDVQKLDDIRQGEGWLALNDSTMESSEGNSRELPCIEAGCEIPEHVNKKVGGIDFAASTGTSNGTDNAAGEGTSAVALSEQATPDEEGSSKFSNSGEMHMTCDHPQCVLHRKRVIMSPEGELLLLWSGMPEAYATTRSNLYQHVENLRRLTGRATHPDKLAVEIERVLLDFREAAIFLMQAENTLRSYQPSRFSLWRFGTRLRTLSTRNFLQGFMRRCFCLGN